MQYSPDQLEEKRANIESEKCLICDRQACSSANKPGSATLYFCGPDLGIRREALVAKGYALYLDAKFI